MSSSRSKSKSTSRGQQQSTFPLGPIYYTPKISSSRPPGKSLALNPTAPKQPQARLPLPAGPKCNRLAPITAWSRPVLCPVFCGQPLTYRNLTCSLLIIWFYCVAGIYLLLVPIIFRTSVAFQRSVLFMNHIRPKVLTPQETAFFCTTTLHLNTADNVGLGVWSISPAYRCAVGEPAMCNSTLATADLTILYAHGTGCSRTQNNRLVTYRLMTTQLQARVVAFDYRGFGDSTPAGAIPSAAGLTNDTLAVYKWILTTLKVSPKRVLFWGHSLGTAVMVRLLSQLPPEMQPLGTVLESPFTSLHEEIAVFPLAKLFNFLPYFNYTFVDPIVDNEELNFDSLSLLPKVASPLLILHAEDDKIVPFALGEKLYEAARATQPKTVAGKARFATFFAGKGYGHNHIAKAPELPYRVEEFVKEISKK